MAIEATLVDGEPLEDGGVRTLVMSNIRVVDAAGNVLLAPRIFVHAGERASISMSTGPRNVEIEVSSRVEGDVTVVDAALVEDGRAPQLSASAEARRETRPVERPARN